MRRETRTRQAGFTLIEALIAVLVLSIGMLALAGMQLVGMKSNYSAFQRSQATFAAADLFDRIRANPALYVNRRFELDPVVPTGNTEFDAWGEVFDPLLPAPDVSGAASTAKGVLDCRDANPTNADDCTTGNFCGPGNCSICVRWSDSRGERTDQDVAADRRAAVLEFRFCSRLPI
jgi:prepilin-type N-terminal cleavage/methylation domain-containing protein